ncbi:MAG: hypothetical protein J0M08_10235 [Bacteroidetes bacterium]|nr:hypothetical protein [Bacteroidota bacterium]
MRVIGTIPHPAITITVFYMNEKHIVRFEAGPMEQLFKFSKIAGMDDVQRIITPEFIQQVNDRFNDMYIQFKNSITTS